MNKVVVTGAMGFVGKNLMHHLKSAIGFDRKIHDFSNIETLKELFRDAGAIVHLAGINAGSTGQVSAHDMIDKNLDLTRNLLVAIQKYCETKPKVIFLSSMHVYGSSQGEITEETLAAPTSTYGVVKYAQEQLLRQAANFGLIELIIFRTTHIYGAGTKPFYNSNVATMCYKALNQQSIDIYGNGNATIDLIHVDDVVATIEKAIDFKMTNSEEIINLASGITIRVSDVVNCIEQIIKMPIDRNLVDKESAMLRISAKKLSQLLGCSTKTSLKNGLQKQLISMGFDITGKVSGVDTAH